ncbi:MAG TPA: imidazole glycerol phosphate synthase subunit HisF [Bacteroidales bacterium]|nr:imidazole glycerol phosphate synthase subunit HisF [Bacteroidales bacterium]HOK74338.1 imidazole glycerol phosphate synthase subunit HisF [Bacteroidales bacterium]HOM39862.1 imidazole glycerol phosphate synthase subunit HisF [Bacteroidales bacterium]HPP92803.1 imidazole glycerol phosphate synthase subunit HisF [Bacteroidales bacterium]
MLKKRIIPCLDVKDGRTVKGVNFVNIKDAGDAVELASRYVAEGADELVFLDITATIERRKTLVSLVENVARAINIPFTVGGGINSLKDVEAIINAGADKISINTAAVKNPGLITEIANRFGSQCVVVAIDTGFAENTWKVFINGGRTPTSIDTVEWAKRAEDAGAGEILLTSMTADGTRSGFSIGITKKIVESVNIPVIASGGAGSKEDIRDVFLHTGCSAALAASIFHYGEIKIYELKKYLSQFNIPVR